MVNEKKKKTLLPKKICKVHSKKKKSEPTGRDRTERGKRDTFAALKSGTTIAGGQKEMRVKFFGKHGHGEVRVKACKDYRLQENRKKKKGNGEDVVF